MSYTYSLEVLHVGGGDGRPDELNVVDLRCLLIALVRVHEDLQRRAAPEGKSVAKVDTSPSRQELTTRLHGSQPCPSPKTPDAVSRWCPQA